jgi:hypothetical protein
VVFSMMQCIIARELIEFLYKYRNILLFFQYFIKLLNNFIRFNR